MRGKRVRKFLGLFVLLTLAIALGGCADKKAAESSSSITIGIPQDIDESLDPHIMAAAGTKEVFFNVYEGLVKPTSDGNLVPAVASEVKESEDGSVYTFTLREGIKFHDGSLVTVEDVKYSLEKCADTANGGPLVPAFANIDSVNILDESTVEVKLAVSDTDFMAYMTTAIIPASNTEADTNPIGTGPYKFVSHSPQESLVLERFEGYWGDLPEIKDVTFKICANPDSIVMELEGGSVDLYPRVTAAQAAQLSDDFEVLEGTMNLVQALYLNNAVAPFDDVRVRQALAYATDPQEIMDIVSDGAGTQIGSSMFPAFGKYFMPELNNIYNLDLEKAKELLKEAGYEDGFSFTITVPSNYPQHIETAQVLAEQYKRIGVDAKINLIEWSSWLSDVYSDRKYEATVVGVDASSLTASALLQRFTSDASKNFINFNSPEYDEAYARAVASTVDAEKTAAYKECETILAQQAANVYIQDLPEFVAIRKGYSGYEFYPLYVQDVSLLKAEGAE